MENMDRDSLYQNALRTKVLDFNEKKASLGGSPWLLYLLKVSKSWKQIMLCLILPKIEWTQNTILSVFRSFFGRVQPFIISFWDLLTFIYVCSHK